MLKYLGGKGMEIGPENERRITKRMPCILSGRYTSRGSYFCELGCEDISIKGAKVFTLQPLKVNNYLRFDITTKKRSLVPVDGKVCWSRKAVHGWHSGITFDKDLPFDVKRII
jgi:PilZ domain-containing protein